MDDRGGRAIIAIDLLRFACALLVVGFHFGTAFAHSPSPSSAILLAGLPVGSAPGTWFGWVGVELFFVISGFVIAFSAESGGPADFVGRRALRLLPAAWLCASASFVVLAFAAPQPGLALAWLRSVAFWPTARWIDPSYWTLAIEAAFYLLIATGLRSADRAAAIERRGLLIGALSLMFWLVATLSDVWPMMDYRPFQLLLLPQGCCFALGILAWGMARRGVTVERVGLTALFYLTTLIDITARSSVRGHPLGWRDPIPPMLVFTAGLAIVFAATRLQPLARRWIDPRTAATFGLLTYPLYLLHQEIGAAIVGGAMRLGLSYWPAAALASTIVLAMAWIVAARLEPALRNLVRSLSRFRGPASNTRPSASLPNG